MAACTTEVERMAARLVEAKDGVMQLVVFGDAAQRRAAKRRWHLGNGASKMGLAAGGARVIGHHPDAGVPEGAAGWRQVGRNGGRLGRHWPFHRTVDCSRAHGEASGLGGGGGGGCWVGI